MKLKTGHYFLIVIIVVSLVFLLNSIAFTEVRSKLLPIIASGLVFILAAIELGRELLAHRQKIGDTAPEDGKAKAKTEEGLMGNMVSFAWLAGIVAAIYLVGYFISIPLFVFLYLKVHGKKWLTSLFSAAVIIGVLYLVFVMALQVELYPGLVFGGR